MILDFERDACRERKMPGEWKTRGCSHLHSHPAASTLFLLPSKCLFIFLDSGSQTCLPPCPSQPLLAPSVRRAYPCFTCRLQLTTLLLHLSSKAGTVFILVSLVPSKPGTVGRQNPRLSSGKREMKLLLYQADKCV